MPPQQWKRHISINFTKNRSGEEELWQVYKLVCDLKVFLTRLTILIPNLIINYRQFPSNHDLVQLPHPGAVTLQPDLKPESIVQSIFNIHL